MRHCTPLAHLAGLTLAAIACLAACKPSVPGAGMPWKNYPALTQNTTSSRWLVVKCQLSDVSSIPVGLDTTIKKFFGISGAGYGNMIDYFHDVSYNRASVIADTVVGWNTAQIKTADLVGNGKFAGPGLRAARVATCLQAVPANQLPDLTAYQGVIVVNNVVQDGGACATGAITLSVRNVNYNIACVWFDPLSLNTEFAMHEIGHGLGLGHSYDDAGRICANNNPQPGEYCDPFDIMSAQITYQFPDANWPIGGQPSGAGPGLDAPGLLKMGWLPAENQRRFQIENGEETHVLHALSRPRAGQPMVVILDVGSEAAFGGIYTVEYRQNDGWDRGFATAAPAAVQSNGGVVLVHQFRLAGAPTSTLISGAFGGALTPCNTIVLPGFGGTTFHVSVESFDTANGTATVSVGTGRGKRLLCLSDRIQALPRSFSGDGVVDTSHIVQIPH
jgi:hypothetical protein